MHTLSDTRPDKLRNRQAQVIGWGNLAVIDGTLRANFGYSAGAAPRDAAFRAGLEAELERLRVFLAVT